MGVDNSQDILVDYVQSNIHPIGSVLANQCRRESLRRLFSPGSQGDLFGDPLDASLDMLAERVHNEKGVYRRWKQKVEGKERWLSVPSEPLQVFLDSYLKPLVEKQDVHRSCHGGINGWSPRKSLESHLPMTVALSFDMQSAFQNIPIWEVFAFFYNSLAGFDNYEEGRDVAGFLTFISTVKYDEHRGLPQGSTVSQSLFNRIMCGIDETIFEAASERGMTYSRWVDDFTIGTSERRDVRELLGAVDLLDRRYPVARDKVFYQDIEPIYLLGHKVVNGRVLKNSKEEKLRNKAPPLNYDECFNGNGSYERWD